MKFDFNGGWFFKKLDGKGGAEVPVRLPHDAMLCETRDPRCPAGKQSGYFPGGKYLYEKEFELDAVLCSRPLKLLFEGVYQNCTVEVNGITVCSHFYGYTEFEADISCAVHEGTNTVRVTADNTLQPNCRWYSGAGIYRPVWLVSGENEEPVITTLSVNPAVVEIKASSDVSVYDNDVLIYSGAPGRMEIPDAKLWSAETPRLYKCVCGEIAVFFGIRLLTWSAEEGLCVNGKRVLLHGGCIHHDNGVLGACGFRDAEERRVRILKQAGYNAIRSAHNPMSRAMLDACDRLGMYVMDEAFDGWYTPKNYHDYSRRFPTDWKADLAAMVKKDLNHPCVIMYSIGNEVSETAERKGVITCEKLVSHVKTLDDTRPVTCGVNVLLNVYANMGLGVYKDSGEYKASPLPERKKGYREKKTGSAFFNAAAQRLGGLMFFMSKGKKGDRASRGAAGALDILGLNYAACRYDEDVRAYPKRMMVGSETMVTDLPYNWERVTKYPAVVGDFVWAAWDYLGEAGVGDWTYHSYPGLPLLAGSGTVDITGLVTAESYYQQIIWGLRTKPYIAVSPLNHAGETPVKSAWRFTNGIESWSWRGYEGKTAEVEVFAAAERIRLYLNGERIAEKKVKNYRARFRLPYKNGTLAATALDKNGMETGRSELRTGGAQVRLTAKPEAKVLRANADALCFIPVEFTDENGLLLPSMEEIISVSVEGPAKLQGFGSAICKTDESYLSGAFHAYRGRALAVIRSVGKPGRVKVSFRSGDLYTETELAFE